MIKTQLIDRRNYAALLPLILSVVRTTQFQGLDCETQDDARHEGLNLLMKVDDETRQKGGNTKLVFDMRRTVITGFSIYPEGHDVAWYFNLAHADVENRLSWEECKVVLDARPANGFWVSHNATYELTAFASCFGLELENIICTMQMSVTAFGDDNYDIDTFKRTGLLGMEKWPRALMGAALRHGASFQEDEDEEEGGSRRRFGREVEDIIGKITSKESDADHSYNGYVKTMAWGHGLKQLVWTIFGHKMSTFKETMGENAHMGQLTGDQVAGYGAEDAYWVIPLMRHLMTHIAGTSPDALETFFLQENPMVHVFSDLWRGGMRVYFDNIVSRREMERAEYANLLRSLRAALRDLMPFDEEAHPELKRREKWYFNHDKGTFNGAKYRRLLADWVALDDHEDDFEECIRVSSAVGNAWFADRKDHRPRDIKKLLSIQHYMPQRVLLYDLMRSKLIFDMGKIQSNGEARGKIKTWFEENDPNPAKLQVIECLNKMAGVDQRMKLYLTPYVLLTDPETQRLYPIVSKLLNTRRLAAATPNAMQLAKRGESTYVRGFFKGDTDEHMIVSLDWSAIELVIVGELSKDPEFKKAFGQRPHEDLHTGATAAVLGVEMPWITEDHIKSLRGFRKVSDFLDNYSLQPEDAKRLFTNLKGEEISDPGKARSYWRTEVGKVSNFNYWFSGWLHTVGQKMGWGMNQTGIATDLYRSRFAVAEEWRIDLIEQARTHGWVQLPDGHRRFRYEATYEWMDWFKAKWPSDQILDPIVHEIARRIHKRAHNQAVNAVVQGTCATIMTRSILRMREKLKENRWDARFMIPIHDEKVYSVHHSLVPEFVELCREVMISHQDIFPTLALEATPAVGVTFEPWHPVKAPIGQVELFEPPAEIVGADRAEKPLDADGIREVVDYLRGTRMKLAA